MLMSPHFTSQDPCEDLFDMQLDDVQIAIIRRQKIVWCLERSAAIDAYRGGEASEVTLLLCVLSLGHTFKSSSTVCS